MSTTNNIAPPEIGGEDHPDRHLSCHEAIEPAFKAVAEMAEKSWSAAEIAATLVDFADNHMLARAANIETVRMIEEVKR